ncbi:unnamed protein product [Urochloa decumbens]|uniref:O-fucosyltransferase family protein n=1 Tax=Urochloa decumbens TaxID=240449 RepID=A0ABC8ZBK1_9POAL
MRRGLGSEGLVRRHREPAKLWIAVAALVAGTIWLLLLLPRPRRHLLQGSVLQIKDVDVNKLWRSAYSNGWRASSAPRTYWPSPPTESDSSGYLRVRLNGGLNKQHSAISNAVVVAQIMNATLVLPEFDTKSFGHDESGLVDIYDVPHFMKTLQYDVRIVMSIPKITAKGNTTNLRVHKIAPPRDAPVIWYRTVALEEIKKHGAIYLTPFFHRLAEEIDDPELQRLRCRVNYHALRFKPYIMKTSSEIVTKLRSEGHFMSVHPLFELDVLESRELVLFTRKGQKIMLEYLKNVHPRNRFEERRLLGKCPLTPEEVGLILRAMGFDNTTRIYLAYSKPFAANQFMEHFAANRFMKPLKALFPRLENHTTVGPGKLDENTRGLMWSAVDYMVCLLSDIFVPTYDGPSNLANNLMGHRLYNGFQTTITPDRWALARIFTDREEGRASGFEERVRRVMFNAHFGGPHKRIHPESFYTNPWPECFCQTKAKNHGDRCPQD